MTDKPAAAGGSSTHARPFYATLAKRVAISIALMVLLSIPTAILFAINHESASTWATVSAIAGVMAVTMGGVEVGVFTAIVIGLLAPISVVAGQVPITGAALMALMCMTCGRMSRVGLHRCALLVPVFLAWMILDPPLWGSAETVDRTDPTYLAWIAVIFFVGAIVPVIVLPFVMRKYQLWVPKPHPRREAIPYTATITLLASVSTYYLLEHPEMVAGAWLIATILMLSQVGDVGTVRMTIGRVVGTVVGLALLGLIISGAHSMTAIYIVGLVLAVAALTAKFSPHYWIYVALVTPTVVCLNASSSSQLKGLGEQRALFTLVGAGMVLLASCVTIGFAHWSARHWVEPTTEEPVLLGQSAAPAGASAAA